MFDFSRFFHSSDSRTRPEFTFLGYSIEGTEMLLSAEAGVYNALREANEAIVDHAGKPTSPARVLIVLQHYGFDTTLGVIAAACGLKPNSVRQYLGTVRKWLDDAFKLRLECTDERVFLVDPRSVREKADKLAANIEKLNRQMEVVRSCATSLRQSGHTVILPPKVEVFLAAHEQSKALEAGTPNV